MKRFAVALLFALPISAMAASSDSSSASADTSSSRAAMQASPSMNELEHGKMVGSLSFTGVYTYQKTQNAPGVSSRNLAGWGIMPAINFTKHLGLQADFVSSYTMDVNPAINRFMIAAGPRYTLNPYWKATPFVFGEAGETRISYGRNISGPRPNTSWEPTASAGIGLDFKVSPNWAIQVVPGQWTGERFDVNGQWQHSYMARVGFVFNLRK